MVKKRERPINRDEIDKFASGAEGSVDVSTNSKLKEKSFVRLTFSLTEHENKLIDELSLKPRSFRCNRSQVVKAALTHLASLSEKEIISILEKQNQLA